MKIEAVTVSVDYSEWLRKCVGNKDKFDRWVIVTVKDDIDTQRICKENDIECVVSERVFENASFAKGRAINDGLKVLDRDGWLIHLDADIVLPNNFREIVKEHCKDTTKLYGSVRYDESGDKMLGQNLAVVVMSQKKVKSKHIRRFDVPVGYFQMWHSSIFTEYPENSKTGKTDDWNFAMRFRPRGRKKSLKDYMSGFCMLSLDLLDVNGFQGTDFKHHHGLRNISKNLP